MTNNRYFLLSMTLTTSLIPVDVLNILFVLVCSELNETSIKLTLNTKNLFESAQFPNIGDIPILNNKVFKARRVFIREHPYIASIRRCYVHYLTGTIITRNLILTVAHPLIDVPIYELGVVVGQNYADRGTIINTVIFVIIHQNFDRYTLQNDIAILRMFENIIYKAAIKSIAINIPSTKLHGTAFVTGWGRCDTTGLELCLPRYSKYNEGEIMDPMLRSVSFTISLPNYYCEGYTRNNIKMNDGMICIGPAREEKSVCPCLAIPGAPLVVNASLAGLSSWGYGCGNAFDLPLVYTDVAYYYSWIVNNSKIQRNIRTPNITMLYKATKAYLLLKWMNETRIIKPTLTLKSDRFMKPLGIDKMLSASLDLIYDIRDYINEGAYHDHKMDFYNEYRKEYEKMEKILLFKSDIIITKPFLNKEALRDIEFR